MCGGLVLGHVGGMQGGCTGRVGIQGGYTGWVSGGLYRVLPQHPREDLPDSGAGPGRPCRGLEWVVR